MASFSFSFSGDDIEADEHENAVVADASPAAATQAGTPATATAAASAAAASAFPVQGRPQLPPCRHSLRDMLARLPSKIAYGLLDVQLEADEDGDYARNGSRGSPDRISLPRRELWDVRVQVMAEADDEDGKDSEIAPGLGTHDVKTGIYEGGFKSWESSIDLVKVLLRSAVQDGTASTTRLSAVAADVLSQQGPAQVLELGCGTALPSLALFQWACALRAPPSTAGESQDQAGQAGQADQAIQADQTDQTNPAVRGHRLPLSLTVADYNPSVLHLVTLPNLILAWALQRQHAEPSLLEALSEEEDPGSGGELELTDAVKDAFCAFLDATNISLHFLSGGWSTAFTDLLYDDAAGKTANTLVLGAETIYSPFALEAFSDTLLSILGRVRGAGAQAAAVVGAKKLYFGVGGSLDDFVRRMRDAGAQVDELREETDGVRRGVVQCLLP